MLISFVWCGVLHRAASFIMEKVREKWRRTVLMRPMKLIVFDLIQPFLRHEPVRRCQPRRRCRRVRGWCTWPRAAAAVGTERSFHAGALHVNFVCQAIITVFSCSRWGPGCMEYRAWTWAWRGISMQVCFLFFVGDFLFLKRLYTKMWRVTLVSGGGRFFSVPMCQNRPKIRYSESAACFWCLCKNQLQRKSCRWWLQWKAAADASAVVGCCYVLRCVLRTPSPLRALCCDRRLLI